ncbi:MAG: hypothetical protein R2874_06150 [Desulfobacterales bacterium]
MELAEPESRGRDVAGCGVGVLSSQVIDYFGGSDKVKVTACFIQAPATDHQIRDFPAGQRPNLCRPAR